MAGVSRVIQLGIVAAIRTGLVRLEGGPEIGGIEDEGLTQRVGQVGMARITVSVSPVLAITQLTMGLVVALAEVFLEEGGDAIGYTVKLLVALSLCDLETTGDMSPDEWHRDGVRARTEMAEGACAGGRAIGGK
jgi:hypothetical protein